MSTITLQKVDTGAMKWGYAFAGACALGFAALIQVAFGGLDEEALANLPAIVTVPYGIAGKLGITVPLALLGVGLILRDVLVNRRGGIVKPDDLEEAEPLAEEVPSPALAPKPGKKIAALAGGFEGRHHTPPPTTGGPVGDAVPIAQRPGSGQVVLSSAKYLNKNPSGCFRKGTSSHTNDE
jgi:hypothetical protein